jgi:thiamine pyrophosphate-dependent acetolactate synthase large subunit-like protein
MTHTGADVLLQRLRSWSVQWIFGYSRHSINGIIDAIRRLGGEIDDFMQTRRYDFAALLRHDAEY